MPFSAPQRSLVFRALDEAEGRTAGYYCIPPFRWEQLRYDLLTQVDHGWEPLPDPTFARVRFLQSIHARQPFDFYRIELNDRSILAAAKRENLLRDLLPVSGLHFDSRNGAHGPAQQHSGPPGGNTSPLRMNRKRKESRAFRGGF